MLIVLALVTAFVLGTLTALLVTPALGVALAVLLLAAGVVAHRTQGPPRRAVGITLLVALLAGGSWFSLTALELVEALSRTEGTADPADPTALAEAEQQLAGVEEGAAFRIELTEPQLQAVVQQGINDNGRLPVRRIDLDLRGATRDIAFVAGFKAGTLTASGTATVTVQSGPEGGVDLQLGTLDFGGISVPGVASGAIQQVLGSIADLNAALAAQRTVVQSIDITDDRMVVIGTRAGTPLTGGQLLASIRAQAAGGVESVAVPPEVLGPGTVDALEAPGDPVVLALGDSLAANVGVDRAADGYVSRFHRAVGEADGTVYGLTNLGVSGETSATMLRSGQLDRALDVLASRPTAYVTIDIGANDLLGHLESADCGTDLRSPACQQRVDTSLDAYEQNLRAILQQLTGSAGSARVLLLTAYNPFSLGLGDPADTTSQEAESTAMVARLNDIARNVATPLGVGVADGFTPMLHTAAATTHMLDPQPDVHPNARGHDILAAALLDAATG